MTVPASITSPSAIDRFMVFTIWVLEWLKNPGRIAFEGRRRLGLSLSGQRSHNGGNHPGYEFYFCYELARGADAGRAHYAALFHHRLHFT